MKCPIHSLSFNFRVAGSCSAECHKQHSWSLCSATNKATAKERRLLPWQIKQEGSREPPSQRWGFSGAREHNVTWSVCPQWASGRASKASALGGSWGQGTNVSYTEISAIAQICQSKCVGAFQEVELLWFSLAGDFSRFESSVQAPKYHGNRSEVLKYRWW